MDILAQEMINIHGDTYGITLHIPMLEAKLLSIGICSTEIENAVMDFLLTLAKNK